MKVVYSCYGGAHSSRAAAAIHLGLLPADRAPRPRDLLSIPRFDDVGAGDMGILDFMGSDVQGHEVYVLGRGAAREVAERALKSGFALAGGSPDEILFVDALAEVNLIMRVGGFLSRRLGWVALGRPLAAYGTAKAFPRLVRLVEEVKRKLPARA